MSVAIPDVGFKVSKGIVACRFMNVLLVMLVALRVTQKVIVHGVGRGNNSKL